MEDHYIRLIPKEIRELGFPIARFLSEEEQAKYEESIKQFSGNAYDSLNILRKGSNLWKVLFLNQIGIRTPTLPELEIALENGMPLSEHYVNGREVILRSRGDSYQRNNYLAETLADKLKLKSFKHPYIIRGLGIKQSETPKVIDCDGLEFLTDDTEVKEAPDFNHENHGKKFRRINEDYSIEWDEKGSRTFYARKDGLSRLFLSWGLDLGSDNERLAGSGGYSRVVVIS